MTEARSSGTDLASRQHIENLPPHQKKKYDYGGNPLAHIMSYDGQLYSAFGGALQPGLYKPPKSNIANPAPLGLAGFALTTFVLSCINLGTRGLMEPNLVVGPAYAYGGLVQLLAGMWEIAQGNTFGGTALSSYGGFWISIGVILTPGGFGIQSAYDNTGDFYAAFGLYLFGWMILTILLWLLTLKATLVFNVLLLSVWLTFMLLGISYVRAQGSPEGMPDVTFTRAGGGTGIIAAFLAWYLMLSGMADSSNSFFVVPVFHFPWSEKGREARQAKKDDDDMGAIA
ncbi:Acetate permease A [Pseudocercospora fuligena]|uniref:Acetate permease A n=1 Tax=Pseudocercospora fuligena TaxID=685502 RepID=A0A8H6RR07_9PEZI|nr:Acetate permease A [Pseudocercospora fuligena]